MAIPTSGTYDGLYLYDQTVATAGTAALLATLQSDYLTGSGLAFPTEFLRPVERDASATFSGSSVTFSTSAKSVTLDDSATYAQGTTGFGFTDAGTNYVVSNGALPDTITLDHFFNELITYFNNTGNVVAADAFTSAKTQLGSDGSLVIMTNGGIFTDQPYQPPCFARGTLIATVDGDKRVETLESGDHVLLARGGSSVVRWIGHRRVHVASADRPELQRPIRVRAGALGNGVPHRDLLVSPDHALFLDGVLVPAGLLVDGERIRQENVDTIEYFHVELAEHDVLLAEGAAAESYLDTGNRHTFANADLVALRPEFPDTGSERIGTACAELVLGGDRLDVIRAHLAALPAETARIAS